MTDDGIITQADIDAMIKLCDEARETVKRLEISIRACRKLREAQVAAESITHYVDGIAVVRHCGAEVGTRASSRSVNVTCTLCLERLRLDASEQDARAARNW